MDDEICGIVHRLGRILAGGFCLGSKSARARHMKTLGGIVREGERNARTPRRPRADPRIVRRQKMVQRQIKARVKISKARRKNKRTWGSSGKRSWIGATAAATRLRISVPEFLKLLSPGTVVDGRGWYRRSAVTALKERLQREKDARAAKVPDVFESFGW